VVRNLAMFNGVIIVMLVGYAHALKLPLGEIIPLVLTAVLASIPVALPATFTLAAALGARALAHLGVLPTRLSAVDEAASIDVLCADKTGTLTQNELKVTAVRPCPASTSRTFWAGRPGQFGWRAGSGGRGHSGPPPQKNGLRSAETDQVRAVRSGHEDVRGHGADPGGATVRAVKGAFAAVPASRNPSPDASKTASELEAQGFRVLAVAVGPPAALKLAGIIALSDPPRPGFGGADSRNCARWASAP
jgi:H+-transporting ATPase